MSSEIGIARLIEINALFINISGGLKPILTIFLNTAALLIAPCDTRIQSGKYGSFILKGRDSLPIESDAIQMSPPEEFDLNKTSEPFINGSDVIFLINAQ